LYRRIRRASKHINHAYLQPGGAVALGFVNGSSVGGQFFNESFLEFRIEGLWEEENNKVRRERV